MFSLLNLLTLELENLAREGQKSVILSDRSLEFLRGIPPLPSAGADCGLPSVEKSCRQDSYPTNALTMPQDGNKEFKYNWLCKKVLNCPVCRQHVRPGKKIVMGIGNLDADIFFCGEAPGAEEETVGQPFVGRAGQLLTKMIAAMGLSRADVYIGNIMNWRPEMPSAMGNRPPTQEEMQFCLPYLRAQIEIVKPKVIIALGATAADGLLGHDPSRLMKHTRGKWFEFHSTPLMVTFHPSYLLRNGANSTKRMVWEDMLAAMEGVGMPISDKQRKFFL